MANLTRIKSLCRNLFRKHQVELELNEEVQSYLDLLVQRKIEQGIEPGEALRLSLIELGGVEQMKERVREVKVGHYLETMLQDVKYGIRVLARNRLFTAVVVVTLALGIGANTAIFSVVNALLLRPLPYNDPDRLVWVGEIIPQGPGNPITRSDWVPGPHILEWARQTKTLEQIAAFNSDSATLTGLGDPEKVDTNFVTASFFPTLGIQPFIGRLFLPADEKPGAESVTVISYSFWQRRFGSDPNVTGRTMVLDDKRYTIIGVQGLDKEITPEIYFPYKQMAPTSLMLVIRTTKDPVSIAAAVRGEVNAIDNGLPVYEVKTMDQRMAESVAPRRFNLILLGSFAFLALSLAAVGVYGVIAYAVTQRTQEIGIRMALGARGSDVLKLLIGQGMVQTAIGIVLGLAGAWALTRLMKTLLFGVSATDPFTFAGVSVLLMVVALLACYVPARRAARIDPMQALRQE